MAAAEEHLIKMAELARRSGVPAPTIKHYIREGLLPEPAKRTGRNMAYYDAGLVPRIRLIKDLQRSRFLPLKVIKEVLERADTGPAPVTRELVDQVLRGVSTAERRPRTALVGEQLLDEEVDWLEQQGVIVAEDGPEGPSYTGNDLELLQTLIESRRAGLRRDLLPPAVLLPYIDALRDLARQEVALLRAGVLTQADDNPQLLVEQAAALSERLVVLLRRRLVLEAWRASDAAER